MKKIGVLFFCIIVTEWSIWAQANNHETDVISSSPKEYHSPLFYASASIIPGLGQFLLGEPKKGTTLVLLNVASIAASAGGYTAVAMRQRPMDKPQLNKTVTNLWGLLSIAGTVGWIATEVFSISDAYQCAKRLQPEICFRPVVLYSPSYENIQESFVPGFGLTFRF